MLAGLPVRTIWTVIRPEYFFFFTSVKLETMMWSVWTVLPPGHVVLRSQPRKHSGTILCHINSLQEAHCSEFGKKVFWPLWLEPFVNGSKSKPNTTGKFSIPRNVLIGGTCKRHSSTAHYDNLAVVHQFPHSSLLTTKLLSAEHEPPDFKTAVLIISGVINVILFNIIGAPLLQERDSAFILSDSKCPSCWATKCLPYDWLRRVSLLILLVLQTFH